MLWGGCRIVVGVSLCWNVAAAHVLLEVIACGRKACFVLLIPTVTLKPHSGSS